ncbi:DUF6998 domain-containing protein [Chitinilyticum aquatile]|uniref:DUF6998 domain-containing protein n=1 Tax=Chitinilyticum aquatile TaxID=362520 RepID=UPI00048DEE35|nr:hypothetical protein [Chitinilyticum aquatile]
MGMTQIQLIQSLGSHLGMLEQELEFDVPATELRHLIGRIGELYAALLTNGRLASEVNQRGHDVVGKNGQRISVKTTAKAQPGQVSVNANTANEFDRLLILRVNTDEMEIEVLRDLEGGELREALGKEKDGKYIVNVHRPRVENNLVRPLKVVRSVAKIVAGNEFVVSELENGSVEIKKNGVVESNTKQACRLLAREIGMSIVNVSGNFHNTRQLGYLLIRNLSDI